MKSSSSQRFQEECLADKGYRFLKRDGDDVIWQFNGLATVHTVRIKPNGDREVELDGKKSVSSEQRRAFGRWSEAMNKLDSSQVASEGEAWIESALNILGKS
jgi:hypothetical protein